jgi:hypothetical protein
MKSSRLALVPGCLPMECGTFHCITFVRVISVFTPVRYTLVKIAHSSFEVLLRTMKHTVIYPSSGPSSEVIALYPVVRNQVVSTLV